MAGKNKAESRMKPAGSGATWPKPAEPVSAGTREAKQKAELKSVSETFKDESTPPLKWLEENWRVMIGHRKIRDTFIAAMDNIWCDLSAEEIIDVIRSSRSDADLAPLKLDKHL